MVKHFLKSGFLADCLKRTAFIAVLVTVYLYAYWGVEVSLFYFSGAAFMGLLVMTLALAAYEFIIVGKVFLGFFFLALHGVVLLLMIPFYGTLIRGFVDEQGFGELAALLAGVNTFFIIAILRGLGEQLIERLNRHQSPIL